ncbi:hypothetical protein BKA70DRAFT_1571688 [Coprinopsis sp. MPI-PUGE-AT-0042]|nr:hypothetical protein BKA70DRAFT_1571688 [Coprinopsis sp. MPI-PUGE-AT-0042]
MDHFSLPRRPGQLSTPPEMMDQTQDELFTHCYDEPNNSVQPPCKPFERKVVESQKSRRRRAKWAKKGNAELALLEPTSTSLRIWNEPPEKSFQPELRHAQSQRTIHSQEHYALTTTNIGHKRSTLQEGHVNALPSLLPPAVIRLARERVPYDRQARGVSHFGASFSSTSQTITVKASTTPANQDPSNSGSRYSTASTSSTTNTKTAWETWTAPNVPAETSDPEVPSDASKPSGSCLVPRVGEVILASSFGQSTTNSCDPASDSASLPEGEEDKETPIQEISVLEAYCYELEEFELERRGAMIAKLHETLGKMEIELEKRIFQIKAASRTRAAGRVKDELIMLDSVELRAETQLRQEYADAVQRLRLDMERELEEEVRDYTQKTSSSTLSNPREAGKEISEPSQQARNEGAGANITHTDLNPSDSDAVDYGTLQSTPPISIEKLEETALDEHSSGQVAASEDWREPSTQSLPTAQRVDAPEVPLDAGEVNLPSTASSISLSKSEGRQPIPRPQPQPMPSTRNFSPADPLRLYAQMEPLLDHDTLGIPHHPTLGASHVSRSGGSVPEPSRSENLPTQSRALMNAPEPEGPGKSTFQGTDNVQVSGGSFVAASTVINNTYYITHIHNAPLPRAMSSNGTARPRSMEL